MNGTEQEFLDGILFAIWGDSYMSWGEEHGYGAMHIRTLDDLPAAPDSAMHLAIGYAVLLVKINGVRLDELHKRACRADGKIVDAKDLGFYLAMQSRGHGVGWTDDHEAFDVKIPSGEWYALGDTEEELVIDGYVSESHRRLRE